MIILPVLPICAYMAGLSVVQAFVHSQQGKAVLDVARVWIPDFCVAGVQNGVALVSELCTHGPIQQATVRPWIDTPTSQFRWSARYVSTISGHS